MVTKVGSKLVSIAQSGKIVCSVQWTPSREWYKTFSVSLVHFDAIPTGWVSKISKRRKNSVEFSLRRRAVLKN